MNQIAQSLHRAHRLLHYDFCPWANRWVYWMKHPLTALIAASLVAVLCGIFVNRYAFVLLGVAAVVGFLGTVWPWIALRGVSGEARFQQSRCRAGHAVVVRLRVRNRFPWPAWGLSIRRGFHESLDESAGIALARVNGWSEMEFEWLFRPERRGVYPLQTPRIDTSFPFGLFHASVPIQMSSELVVWPAAVSLDALPDAAEIQTREDQLTDRRSGHCGDLLGTRPFRDGDSLRRVHWLQTARQGKMIVIERQAPATCAVRMIVDVRASVHRLTPAFSTLETTLSVAASVLESLHRQHAFVECVVGDQVVRVGESSQELRRALDTLARIPLHGETATTGCHFDRPSRWLPTIAMTTDLGLAGHRSHSHVGNGERYIVIRSHADNGTNPSYSSCDCHAWIELSAGVPWATELPRQWRRGCHVA